jgi:hypothetical protein
MLDDLICDDHVFDSIDTSSVDDYPSDNDFSDDPSDDSYNFFESFLGNQDIELDDYSGLEHLNNADDIDDTDMNSNGNEFHSGGHYKSVSFTGLGRCSVCGCGRWAGFGNECENCGHFFDKHI